MRQQARGEEQQESGGCGGWRIGRGRIMNTRMPRTLVRRMERLEARLAPVAAPLVIINLHFVSSDGRVVEEREVRVGGRPLPTRTSRELR